MDGARAQIYGAIIVALVSMGIAVGTFLHSSGQIEAHLGDLERRETRMEEKVDDIREYVHRIDLRLVRMEERSNGVRGPRALREDTLP